MLKFVCGREVYVVTWIKYRLGENVMLTAIMIACALTIASDVWAGFLGYECLKISLYLKINSIHMKLTFT